MTGAPGDGAPGQPPAPESPRRTAMLSELAAELRAARAESRRDVEQLRARFEPELSRLGELLADNADLLGQLAPRVVSLEAEVTDLADRLDEVTAAGGGPGKAPTDWPALDSAAAVQEWKALATWLDGVVGPFYGWSRRQLPDCWALHPRVVIELVWLRRCYVAAADPAAPPVLAADWHTRLLRDALANIADAVPAHQCGPGRHQAAAGEQHRYPAAPTPPPPPPQAWPHPGSPEHLPPPAGYGPPGGFGASSEVISREFWGRFYDEAMRVDLDRRRAREGPPHPGVAASRALNPPRQR